MRRLGIIDWGIGGVSIYAAVKKQLGDVPVVYFSDTGVTPYGKMSRRELVERLDTVIEFLKSRGASHIMLGCNAASTAIPFLAAHDVPVEGVIEPAVAMTAKFKPTKLGLIGGRRTVVSGVYRRAFAEFGIDVRQRIAQPLSRLIESGDTSSTELQAQAKQILTPIKHASHILLACTHYPAITNVLRSFVSPNTKFIDPTGEVVKTVKRWKLRPGAADEFLTSGDAASMKRAARSAFGVKIGRAAKIKL
ncbi:MAG: glutamate racemase [Pyrinomonadaceae bacterium]